jgi:hypothetical protein
VPPDLTTSAHPDVIVALAARHRLPAVYAFSHIVAVPAGFDTDGTSVPRLLWWWQPPIDGKACRASLSHDFLYRCLSQGRPHPLAPTRRIADKRMYQAALDAGLSHITAWLLWVGVRIGGRSHAKRPTPSV